MEFQNDLKKKGGLLYQKVRNFLIKYDNQNDEGITKNTLESRFGRENLDFCFEVEQLIFLEQKSVLRKSKSK